APPAAAPSTRQQRKARRARVSAPGTARRALPWLVALAGCVVLTANGARIVNLLETRPSPVYPAMRRDPIVDRALIAERVSGSLRAASIAHHPELVLLMRERIALQARVDRGRGEKPPPAEEVYPEGNVKTAVFGGYGIRAVIPAVDSVSFALAPGIPG